MTRTAKSKADRTAAPPPPGSIAAIEAIEARLLRQVQPGDEIAALLVGRAAALAGRLDAMTIYDAAMTARRVRYARVGRENQRWAEVIAVVRTNLDDPTEALRKLRQTPEGFDWLIREWGLLEAEVAAGLDPLPKAMTVHDRAKLFLGLHDPEQDGGEWAVHCKALELPSSQAGPEEDRAHRDWVAAWAAAHAEALRKERARLDHAAEEEDRNEATARALFDPGPDAERARRYEVSCDRSLLRTIRELERARAREAKNEAANRERTQSPASPPGAIEPIAEPRPGANEPTAAPAGAASWRPAGRAGAGGNEPTAGQPAGGAWPAGLAPLTAPGPACEPGSVDPT